ncbi:segregation and condensation protein B [Spirochaetota bacterium]|nr:segregation and condensation protein B [Spirochaetota bacterium]
MPAQLKNSPPRSPISVPNTSPPLKKSLSVANTHSPLKKNPSVATPTSSLKKSLSRKTTPQNTPKNTRTSHSSITPISPPSTSHPHDNKLLSTDFIAQTLEAMLILEHGTIKITKIKELLKIEDIKPLTAAITLLNKRYAQAKLITKIEKLADTLELRIDPTFKNPVIETYVKKKRKLSPALLETLAIVAYKQPVTKSDIEYIRGASCTSALKILLSTQLVKISGHKDAPGRPPLYRTTEAFLTFFSVTSLRDLPPIKDLKTYHFLKNK